MQGFGSLKDRASATSSSAPSMPDWAKQMRAQQAARASSHAVSQAIKDGDKPGHSANPSLQQKDE